MSAEFAAGFRGGELMPRDAALIGTTDFDTWVAARAPEALPPGYSSPLLHAGGRPPPRA